MTEWINVNDRLPEDQEHYLVRTPLTFPKNCIYQIAEFYTDNYEFYNEQDEHLNDVTHWQPLPEPPTI